MSFYEIGVSFYADPAPRSSDSHCRTEILTGVVGRDGYENGFLDGLDTDECHRLRHFRERT